MDNYTYFLDEFTCKKGDYEIDPNRHKNARSDPDPQENMPIQNMRCNTLITFKHST